MLIIHSGTPYDHWSGDCIGIVYCLLFEKIVFGHCSRPVLGKWPTTQYGGPDKIATLLMCTYTYANIS